MVCSMRNVLDTAGDASDGGGGLKQTEGIRAPVQIRCEERSSVKRQAVEFMCLREREAARIGIL